MSDKTGGPAFPNFKQFDRFDEVSGWHIPEFVPVGGMTLRDYMATKAMQSQMQTVKHCHIDGGWFAEEAYHKLALKSYKIADAMIAERNKDQP